MFVGRNFNPRPPRGGRQQSIVRPAGCRDFNPRPPRGGRLRHSFYKVIPRVISIHAPREGGDLRGQFFVTLIANFNPRPPRGGRRNASSTAPPHHPISIHAPREGGDTMRYIRQKSQMTISIHAPREGGDGGGSAADVLAGSFQSTPPARGATSLSRKTLSVFDTISIHAPREGGDHTHGGAPVDADDFNPRPPRGGRHEDTGLTPGDIKISIHAPREGGDITEEAVWYTPDISIHAPREGGDVSLRKWSFLRAVHFNPRPPRGGRRSGDRAGYDGQHFNPRPPRGGRLRVFLLVI